MQEDFFDMLFIMSHARVIHRGSKLAKSKKSVPHHLCNSATMSLKYFELVGYATRMINHEVHFVGFDFMY